MAVFLLLYFAVLLLLCSYGVHRAHLVWLCVRYRRALRAALTRSTIDERELPIVTVQLPLYNEATVVERLLDSVARFDYPHDRLEIQVLDDSTDETEALARRKVLELRDRGLDVVYLRRSNRVGYKAGALEYGLERAKGSLVAIFDADFVPQPDFLRAVVGDFQDPKVGMVQTRWAHLNRDESLLTSVQALMLDGHHLVENRARFGSGCMFNFSGTGGIWRKAAILDAGGWGTGPASALAACSTSPERAASGARRPSWMRAAGSTTPSRRISISRIARSFRVGASSTGRTW
jgi:cellulose synthase/poly-beta-1,6-N-acetylglucosamine synthase-like glycosyltransferase